MKVEGMNSVSSSYQGQGSSVSTVSVSSVTPVSAEPKAPVTDVLEVSGAMTSGNGGKKPVREEGQASNEQIRQAVDRINKNSSNGEAVFGIHEKTNRVTIKIVDKDTKEVIKEFPPEKTLDMIAKVWEMAGIMVDERR